MSPDQFKQNRKALGLTQKKLGNELRVTSRHISYIETNVRKPSGVLIKCFELLMLTKAKMVMYDEYSEKSKELWDKTAKKFKEKK